MNAPKRHNRGKNKTKATGNVSARSAGSEYKYKGSSSATVDAFGQSASKKSWRDISTGHKKWGN